jgi:ribonucleoside-diphosphate reductase alpha chain
MLLDSFIDVNCKKHPLEKQRQMDAYGRRVGNEFTGLGDMFAMLGLIYGSEASCTFFENIMIEKAKTELITSLEMAKKKGKAPCFRTKKSRERFIEQPYIVRLLNTFLPTRREQLKEEIIKHGLRNSAFATVGPTGTVSIVADNCTSGIEPCYSIKYVRRGKDGSEANIFHYPLLKYAGKSVLNLSIDELKEQYNYRDAYDISYKDRLKIQSIAQKWTDSSISSTINLPKSAIIEDIRDIYLEAYNANLKGVTVFRNGCKKGVLSTGEDVDEDQLISSDLEDVIRKHLRSVKDKLTQTHRSYRFVEYWKGFKVYIIVVVDSNGRPIEVFSELPPESGLDKHGVNFDIGQYTEFKSYWDSICRLISLNLRTATPIDEIIKQLNKSSYSMIALPGILHRVLNKFINVSDETKQNIKHRKETGEHCFSCGEDGVIYEGGCKKCLFCGDSKCG